MSMFDDLDLSTLLSEDTEQGEVEQETETVTKTSQEEADIDEQEAQSGYLRQQDYTRKTQALAAERKALEAERAALQAQLAQLTYQQTAPAEDDEWVDPTERAVADVRQELEALKYELRMSAAERQAQADALAAVKQFDLKVDPQELIAWASANKVYDLANAGRLMGLEMKEVTKQLTTKERRTAASEAALVGGASRASGPTAPKTLDHSAPWGDWEREALALLKSTL